MKRKQKIIVTLVAVIMIVMIALLLNNIKTIEPQNTTSNETEIGGTTSKTIKELNEYGFYYDTPYEDRSEEADGEIFYVVLKSDNTIEFYVEYLDKKCSIMLDKETNCIYSNNKVTLSNGVELTFKNNGKTLDAIECVYTYCEAEYRDVYYGVKYYFPERKEYMVVSSDNTVKLYKNISDMPYYSIAGTEIVKSSHMLTLKQEKISGNDLEEKLPSEWYIGIDGKTIIDNFYDIGYFVESK